jgi:hypothetical protein
VDITPITDRLNAIEQGMSNQPVAAPQPVDFSPISDRMSRIEETLQRFGQQPQQPAPNPWGNRDPQEIISNMLDERLSSLPQPQPPSLNVDLSPIQNDLAALTDRFNSFKQPEVDYSRINEMVGQQVGDLRNSLPAAPQPVSFDPILDRLGQLEQRFEARPQPAMPEVDLSGINSQLSALTNRVNNIPSVDLSGIQSQIGGLQSQMNNIPAPQQIDYQRLASMMQPQPNVAPTQFIGGF